MWYAPLRFNASCKGCCHCCGWNCGYWLGDCCIVYPPCQHYFIHTQFSVTMYITQSMIVSNYPSIAMGMLIHFCNRHIIACVQQRHPSGTPSAVSVTLPGGYHMKTFVEEWAKVQRMGDLYSPLLFASSMNMASLLRGLNALKNCC